MFAVNFRSVARFYLAISVLLIVASLLEIPSLQELTQLKLPSDMPAMQSDGIARSVVRFKVLMSFVAPIYYLALVLAEGVVLWAVFTTITGTTIRVSASCAASIHLFALVVLGRLTHSLVMLGQLLVGMLDKMPRYPLGLTFVADSRSVSPVVAAILANSDIFTVTYVMLLPVLYRKLFGCRWLTSVVVCLVLSAAWLYLRGVWAVLSMNLVTQ